MSNKLSLMPNISIPRSRFKQSFNHSLDMFHGDIVPVDCFEVLPGDEFNYKLSSLIRMSTPIVPIMGNIKAYVHAFFVPMRLIWNETERFYGDPSNHDTVSTVQAVNPTSYTIPKVNMSSVHYLSTANDFIPFLYSVQDYLGKVDVKKIYDRTSNPTALVAFLNTVNISMLKERAYLCIYNDHFRPSLMVPPVLIEKGGNGNARYGTFSPLGGNQVLKYPFKPLKSFKGYDYFTACTYSPQFSVSGVTLPLGLSAPVICENPTQTLNSTVSSYGGGLVGMGADATTAGQNQLLVDLQNATAASINSIRYAFQLQKYFERSNYGSRFFEILNAHYGITNPDSRLQRAERLGSHEFYINVSQVVSTADTVSGSNGQNLGNTGAVSVTGDNCNLFTKSFTEPGYVMVVITTKYDRSYSSGFLREDLRKERFEFYSPEFANLGDQAISKLELQLINGVSGNTNFYEDGTDIFGYQEHWAEYRYRKDLVSGSLRPGQSFDIWTLADDFDGKTLQLGYDFLIEDRTSLSRVLATGSNGPDYICDFHANILATREMRVYSIPGLIDHFGAL